MNNISIAITAMLSIGLMISTFIGYSISKAIWEALKITNTSYQSFINLTVCVCILIGMLELYSKL